MYENKLLLTRVYNGRSTTIFCVTSVTRRLLDTTTNSLLSLIIMPTASHPTPINFLPTHIHPICECDSQISDLGDQKHYTLQRPQRPKLSKAKTMKTKRSHRNATIQSYAYSLYKSLFHHTMVDKKHRKTNLTNDRKNKHKYLTHLSMYKFTLIYL